MKYFLIFCCLWWITFFILLPIGIRTRETAPKGCEISAPIKPRIPLKFVVTTLISIAVTLLLLYSVEKGYIDHEFLNNRMK